MQAFLSYQTEDRHIAAQVRDFLVGINVPAFMAHEDISVSHEWQQVILDEISKADIFIAILSQNYFGSSYCMQESGMAIFRKAEMTIIPLSTDESVSPGFMAHIQSKKIDPNKVSHTVLFAGIVQYDYKFAIDCMINRLEPSRNYQSAEENFQLLLPYLDRATDEQKFDILKAATSNTQIAYAGLCARKYLPPLFATHGHLLGEEDRRELKMTLKRYAAK